MSAHAPENGTTTADGRHAAGRRGLVRLREEVLAAAVALGSLVTSPECAVCGEPDTVLCPPCRSELHAECREPFRAEERAPALGALHGFRVVAAADYARAVSLAILAHKRRGHPRLARELGAILNRLLWSSWDPGPGTPPREEVWLVPVPGSGRSFRERGFDPLKLMLKHCHTGGLPPGLRSVPALAVIPVPERMMRGVLQGAGPRSVIRLLPGGAGGGAHGQKGLGAQARRRRLAGSMRLSAGFLLAHGPGTLAGRRCILVDDVLTTGATVAEAARVLSEAGASVTGAVVLASTRPPAISQEEIHEQGVNSWTGSTNVGNGYQAKKVPFDSGSERGSTVHQKAP
ncbi:MULTISPECIES: phosphoribosyltransferase family protein [Arthrobacter]|uniref:Phosphoribosyltransferase family protein n=2 Tax=Arthrobacter TaxID=1663 RepID=A0ABU9KLS9_9MICC|nr:phosphoribosyltransferase family protein [Arthrobacter sp. YJM1]MDP5227216.1 phosphoribosyltransferase family protein [Arthrobacter sp. YJM1]